MTGKELKSRLAKTGYSFADIAKGGCSKPQTLNHMFLSADVKTGYLEKIASALNLPVLRDIGIKSAPPTGRDAQRTTMQKNCIKQRVQRYEILFISPNLFFPLIYP